MVWIFMKGEGDEIKSKQASKRESAKTKKICPSKSLFNMYLFDSKPTVFSHLNTFRHDHLIWRVFRNITKVHNMEKKIWHHLHITFFHGLPLHGWLFHVHINRDICWSNSQWGFFGSRISRITDLWRQAVYRWHLPTCGRADTPTWPTRPSLGQVEAFHKPSLFLTIFLSRSWNDDTKVKLVWEKIESNNWLFSQNFSPHYQILWSYI